MSELKTQKNDARVEDFLEGVENEQKRDDSKRIVELMHDVTGEDPAMWGESIVGFGEYTYRYASGREGEWMLVGFSPRKQNLTVYIMSGFEEYEDLLRRLGKHKTGKSCLYINKLDDVDIEVLEELVAKSVEHMRRTHPSG
ncbi:MAG: DUF1801 domain-containing protein [Anaerolineales bacterium]|jgi:hypothetical protein